MLLIEIVVTIFILLLIIQVAILVMSLLIAVFSEFEVVIVTVFSRVIKAFSASVIRAVIRRAKHSEGSLRATK